MEKAKEIFRYILAVVIVVSFFGLLGLMVFQAIPDANSELLYTLTGTLGAMVVQIANFFYGSSKSSEDKTKIIANGNSEK